MCLAMQERASERERIKKEREEKRRKQEEERLVCLVLIQIHIIIFLYNICGTCSQLFLSLSKYGFSSCGMCDPLGPGDNPTPLPSLLPTLRFHISSFSSSFLLTLPYFSLPSKPPSLLPFPVISPSSYFLLGCFLSLPYISPTSSFALPQSPPTLPFPVTVFIASGFVLLLQQQLKAEAEEKQREEEDAKRKRIRETREKKEQERLNQLRQQEEAERMRQQMAMAEEHHRMALVKYRGFRPWRKLMEDARMGQEEARRKYCCDLQRQDGNNDSNSYYHRGPINSFSFSRFLFSK